jgi:hypothetical protein
MSLWDSMKSAFDRAENAVEDIITVDVVTLTGRIKITALQNDEKKFDLKKLYERIEDGSALDGEMSVVAFTHIDIDADAIHFVKSDLTEEDRALLTAHNEAVRAAQDTREGIVRMVRSFLK